MQRFFYPCTQLAFYTSMMQSNGTRKLRRNIEQCLIPSLTHTTCVNEDKCCIALFNDVYNFVSEFQTEMSCPGVLFYFIRDDGMNICFFIEICFDDGSAT